MRKADNKIKSLFWLTNTKGVSLNKARQIFAEFDAEKLYTDLESFREGIVKKFGEKIYESLSFSRDDKLYGDMVGLYASRGIEIVTVYDENYPEQLKEISEPPLVLYAKGDLSLLSTKCISVVGSRNLSRYGRDMTVKFTQGLTLAGFTVVSGLARGADSEAHRTALSERGKTIGVLGCGIDVIYPSENRELYAEVEKKGLIISEYPLGVKPNYYQFPERNRIIAGLSGGVLVTEAGEKSGSLITADFAVEYGRGLYVIPANLNSKYGQGSNGLIKKMQAAMVLDVNDILEDQNMSNIKIEEPNAMQLDFNEELIVKELERGDLHFDVILEKTGLSVAVLSSLLAQMELFGIIKKTGNNTYGV